ncbi:MAG: DNA cytosine methyltransferase, partial [Chloroflexota bacterium]
KQDPRNEMFQFYLDVIKLIQPDFLLLENVRGISIGFGKKSAEQKRSGAQPVPFSDEIKRLLEDAGYHVCPGLVKACDYGVPQYRPRWIVFGMHRRLAHKVLTTDPFELLREQRTGFLGAKGLPTEELVTVKDALSDLERRVAPLMHCEDSVGFNQVPYSGPETQYQRLLHGVMNGTSPNSMRLANHREHVRTRFKTILDTCRRGVLLSPADRKRLDLKKQCLVPLDPDKPSHTLTTLPDDFLHYTEPRIMTVREYARLQSFPDWFAFKGKYTTGSDQRVKECPRYTQAANAVPPLLAEVLGLVFHELKLRLNDGRGRKRPASGNGPPCL